MKQPLILILSTLLLAACGTPGEARQERFTDRLDYGHRSVHYQQDSLMLVDPKGDAYLLRMLDTIPIKVFTHLVNGSLPQAERDKRPADFRIGKTLAFDSRQLLNKCREIMRRNYPDIIPTLGEEHKWSPEAKRYMTYGYWHRLWRRLNGKQQDYPCPLFLRSKLLTCLACGWTSRYCVTGQEQALTERILRYPDRGVQLHQLFEESYVLNKGNLYLTFLTCENVLAGQPHRKGRGDDPLQRKLTYIRNDSTEDGDNYGAWYHFFGIALYGMLRPDYVSLTVADTESLGSFFMEGADRQESLINRYGADFGFEFRQMMDRGTWWVPLWNVGTDYMLDPLLL